MISHSGSRDIWRITQHDPNKLSDLFNAIADLHSPSYGDRRWVMYFADPAIHALFVGEVAVHNCGLLGYLGRYLQASSDCLFYNFEFLIYRNQYLFQFRLLAELSSGSLCRYDQSSTDIKIDNTQCQSH